MAEPGTGTPDELLPRETARSERASALFRRSDFRRTYAAVAISELGDAFQYIALMWFALVAAGPLGFIAIEAGWMVTELGRQPWIIYGVMRTREAVTPMPKIAIPFVIFTLIYIFLAVALLFLLRRQFVKTDEPASELITKNV